MDIGTNFDGNSNQVRNKLADLTVLIGSDLFLPQPESPTVEPEFDAVDEIHHHYLHPLLPWSTKLKISPNPSILIWKLASVWILNLNGY